MRSDNKVYIDVNSIEEEQFGDVRKNASENGKIIKDVFLNCFDILVKESEFMGRTIVFSNCDGLSNSLNISEAVVKPILFGAPVITAKKPFDYIKERLLCGTEVDTEKNLDKAIQEMLRGNLLIFIDGESECIVVGAQRIPERAIDEPDTEVQEHGSREGFTENLKTNLSLVRKRLCTVNFKVEVTEIGKVSRTKTAICYMEGKVNKKTLEEVKQRLAAVETDTLLDVCYLQPFLDTKRKTPFSMLATTERPDTFCAKINEGKVAIFVDGSPFAMVLPILFIENFQAIDDYFNRPFYATFMRIIRILSFIFSIALPGSYVAVGLFHQEILPDDMLYNIVMMESNTLFTLTTEALAIHFIYELVREAGLRMPKSIGHAMSIVGALVIGDAAVTAGLIGATMLIVVAMTALSSLVVSDIYQPVSVLRFVFIVVGGFSGLYGIMIASAVLILNLASITDYSVAYLSPLTPYNKSLWRDTVLRQSFKKMSKKQFNINGLRFGGENK